MKNTQGNQEIRVRFAPSPTGVLHVGGARTALFNFLFARQCGGKLILRIEDTDKERSKKEYEADILEGLAWLSIAYDECYRQSERTEVYKKYLQQLIQTGAAYISKEEMESNVLFVHNEDNQGLRLKRPYEEKKLVDSLSKEASVNIPLDHITDGKKRATVIRFKNPNKTVTFHDLIRGDISFDTTDLGDFVIAKDLETPLYNFAVVVDDHDMRITHVIRGEDGISNTPRQILIQEALGAPRPVYAHIPFILAPDRSKLSKRHGAVSVTEYRNLGFLPDALVNFLALIGWNPGTEREIFSIQELTKEFSFDHVQKSGAIFNIEKLRWMNKEYIARLPAPEIKNRILAFLPERIHTLPDFSEARLDRVIPIIKERISTWGDIAQMADAGELDYYFAAPVYAKEKLLWKEETDYQKTRERLEAVLHTLEDVGSSAFTAGHIKEKIWNYATQEGRGFVLWPMRYALSGKDRSPDPFVLAEVLGKDETAKRLTRAIQYCNE